MIYIVHKFDSQVPDNRVKIKSYQAEIPSFLPQLGSSQCPRSRGRRKITPTRYRMRNATHNLLLE
jgi:hypothetical protein